MDACTCWWCADKNPRALLVVAMTEQEPAPAWLPMLRHKCGAFPTWHKTPWMTGKLPGHWWVECACGEFTAARKTWEDALDAWRCMTAPRPGHDHVGPPGPITDDVPWAERMDALQRRMDTAQPRPTTTSFGQWVAEGRTRLREQVRDTHPTDTHVPPVGRYVPPVRDGHLVPDPQPAVQPSSVGGWGGMRVQRSVARFLRYTEEEKIHTVLEAYGLQRVSKAHADGVGPPRTLWKDWAGETFTTDVALHLVMTRPATDYHTRVRLALDAFRKGARP